MLKTNNRSNEDETFVMGTMLMDATPYALQ